MKKNNIPVVYCEYEDSEKPLAILLEESFRLYLIRILAGEAQRVVSSER